MDVPHVVSCDEKLCAYNFEGTCNAREINVGGPDGPFCDTSVRSRIKCGCEGMGGVVGSCKVFACQFNNYMACSAGEIKVSVKDCMPRCTSCNMRELASV